MKLPSSGIIVTLTDSIKNRWRRRCVMSQRQTTSARMSGDFHWSTFSGPASELGPSPFSSSPSSRWWLSSAAGSEPRGNVAPNTVILSSCQLSPRPLSRVHRLPGPRVRSDLRRKAQTFLPLRQPSGSAPCKVPRLIHRTR